MRIDGPPLDSQCPPMSAPTRTFVSDFSQLFFITLLINVRLMSAGRPPRFNSLRMRFLNVRLMSGQCPADSPYPPGGVNFCRRKRAFMMMKLPKAKAQTLYQN
jgi:hypothetical protein